LTISRKSLYNDVTKKSMIGSCLHSTQSGNADLTGVQRVKDYQIQVNSKFCDFVLKNF